MTAPGACDQGDRFAARAWRERNQGASGPPARLLSEEFHVE
jgi:hypothetical protein